MRVERGQRHILRGREIERLTLFEEASDRDLVAAAQSCPAVSRSANLGGLSTLAKDVSPLPSAHISNCAHNTAQLPSFQDFCQALNVRPRITAI